MHLAGHRLSLAAFALDWRLWFDRWLFQRPRVMVNPWPADFPDRFNGVYPPFPQRGHDGLLHGQLPWGKGLSAAILDILTDGELIRRHPTCIKDTRAAQTKDSPRQPPETPGRREWICHNTEPSGLVVPG